jgi:hypothetical protein
MPSSPARKAEGHPGGGSGALLVESCEEFRSRRALVFFYAHWAYLDEFVLVMVVFPMPSVTMPISGVVMVPVFVIPIMIATIFIRFHRE